MFAVTSVSGAGGIRSYWQLIRHCDCQKGRSLLLKRVTLLILLIYTYSDPMLSAKERSILYVIWYEEFSHEGRLEERKKSDRFRIVSIDAMMMTQWHLLLIYLIFESYL